MWQDIRYDKNSYCCEHFLIDAYKYYKQVDLSDKLLKSGFFYARNLANFKQVDKPNQHTIVLFRRPHKAHVGLWVDGRVLHLDEQGVTWQPLEHIKQQFDRVIFYEPIQTKS